MIVVALDNKYDEKKDECSGERFTYFEQRTCELKMDLQPLTVSKSLTSTKTSYRF